MLISCMSYRIVWL